MSFYPQNYSGIFYFGYRIMHMDLTIAIYSCSGGKDGCCSALGPILYSFAAYPIVSGILQHGALLHSSRSIGMCHDSFFKVISCSGCCSWFGAELVLWVASGCIVFARIAAVCLAAFTSSGFFLSFLAPFWLGGCFLLCCLRSSFPFLPFLRTNPNPTEYGAEARWARRCPEVGAGERAFLSLTGCDLFLWVWQSSSLDSISFLVGSTALGVLLVTLPSGVPFANCTRRFVC